MTDPTAPTDSAASAPEGAPSAAATSAQPAIKVANLTKRFGDLEAVSGLSFTVPHGEVCAFVGPNGAGKTTTMRILATLSRPTSGRVRVGGHDCTLAPLQVRRIMGFMPERYGLYKDLPVGDYLAFFAAAYGVPEREQPALVDRLLELTDLANKKKEAADKLSRGMRQRFALARALVHSPKVLVLDEPAAGLDPRARIELRELVGRLREMGVTILISSHILTELEDMCTSVVIIEKGKLVHASGLEDARRALRPKPAVRIEVSGDPEVARALLEGLEFVERAAVVEGALLVEYEGGEEKIAEMTAALVKADVTIQRVSEDKADLEELFMRLTKGDVA